MADRVKILLLLVIAAQCCVSAATQQCTTDPAVALFKPMYIMYVANVDKLKEELSTAKQLMSAAAANACIKEEPMGVEDGRIPDSSLTASSKAESSIHDYGPKGARLNSQDQPGSWSAGGGDYDAWIQVDFTKKVHMTGVVTQGRGDADQWVREYQVAFSQDGSTVTKVADAEGAAITFTGNTDRDTEVTNRFPAVVSARYLRIYPTRFYAYRSMRFEVIGCAHTSTQS